MRKVLYVLGALEDQDLQWMLDAGHSRYLETGETIIEEGGDVHDVFLIVDGEVEVRMGDVVIAHLGAGELVGDMSLVEALPPSASVTASQESTVFAIAQPVMRAKLDSDTRFAARFYRAMCFVLSSRLRRADNELRGDSETETENAYEISPNALENAALAGARFDWFQKRVRGQAATR